jgi:hypothetical protein
MKTSRNRTVPAIIFLVIAMISSCKKNPTGPEVTANVQLSVDYVTCTEVWLKLGFANAPAGGDYRITRDGATVLTGTITGASAVLYDTTAQANKSYSYVAYRLVNSEVKQISPTLAVTTLDSTSNNFTWQTFTLGGDAGSCLLRDVTIINDTLAYAVGEVYLRDSLFQTTFSPNNLLTWDGKTWAPSRILFPTCDPNGNEQGTGSDPAYAIFPFSADNMWVASDASIDHWDGNTFQRFCLTIGYGQRGLRRIWGAQDQFYVVCSSGFILRYDGSWQSIPTGTTLEFQDLWGTVNQASGQVQCLAVACNRFTNNGSAVVQLFDASASAITTSGLPSNISGVWSANGKEWYICGDGLYKSKSLSSSWRRINGVPLIYKESIRGIAANDIFVVGDFGLVLHFNGSTWSDLTQQVNLPNSIFYAVAAKGNLVVMVGGTTSGAIGGAAAILIGRRE